MDYDNGFILQKKVDWSLLNDGMIFPVSVCSLFTSHHIDYFTHSQKVTLGTGSCHASKYRALEQETKTL